MKEINMKSIIDGYQSYRQAIETVNDYRTKATKHALNDDYQKMRDCEQKYRQIAANREKHTEPAIKSWTMPLTKRNIAVR